LRKSDKKEKTQGEQAASCNLYQPLSFDDFSQLQPSPRDRRAPSLVEVHALIVRQKHETPSMVESILRTPWRIYGGSFSHRQAE
jgi:hypothetical protein